MSKTSGNGLRVNGCQSVNNVTYTATPQARTVTIQNCSTFIRADIISITTTNEVDFKINKGCNNMALEPMGNTNDKCNETVTFSGACGPPPLRARFRVEANPGGRVYESNLVGC